MIKNCYIHIPFCKKICAYCDFCKVFYNEQMTDKYLKALDNEIKTIYNYEELETIYIGGGTPSSLSIKELEELFEIIGQLKRKKNCEFTIECNFETITKEKLELFKKNGVNRLSFGIESISSKNLELLERKEDKKRIEAIVSVSRKLGFSNINLDLMYAIPGERVSDLDEDLNFLISLNPEHISTYSLMIEENTKLYLNRIEKIDEDLDNTMYNRICDRLKEEYNHYEISNFSKSGYESKHNLCYWKNNEYYGFGVSASSYRGDVRYTNTKSITKYLKTNYKYYQEKLTDKDKMIYEMILGLRLTKGVSKERFHNRYGINIEEYFDIKCLLEKELILENDSNYYIAEDKLYISNEILLSFIKE